ncbi:hypothetical protein [Streptomyces sp. H27-H5]|uniref:hypothetical protein n=1 Tax=Streptomyces sp. H27-H5 TaxID=2996460 RepID=UPI0022710F98|nr:hypothetical protein [Streptomyces sp. H27-H5]MCY0955835.1 hypothetical protein [Streptomyces sp. H27-H5]
MTTFKKNDVVKDSDRALIGKVEEVHQDRAELTLVRPPGKTPWRARMDACFLASPDEAATILPGRTIRVIGSDGRPLLPAKRS